MDAGGRVKSFVANFTSFSTLLVVVVAVFFSNNADGFSFVVVGVVDLVDVVVVGGSSVITIFGTVVLVVITADEELFVSFSLVMSIGFGGTIDVVVVAEFVAVVDDDDDDCTNCGSSLLGNSECTVLLRFIEMSFRLSFVFTFEVLLRKPDLLKRRPLLLGWLRCCWDDEFSLDCLLCCRTLIEIKKKKNNY